MGLLFEGDIGNRIGKKKENLEVIHHVEACVEADDERVARVGHLNDREGEIHGEMEGSEKHEDEEIVLVFSPALLKKDVYRMDQAKDNADDTNSCIEDAFIIHSLLLYYTKFGHFI